MALLPRNVLTSLRRNVTLFRALELDDISMILNHGRRLNVAADTILIQEGADDRDFYILLSGTVEAYIFNTVGKKKILNTIESPQIVGEISPLVGFKRTANVQTTSDCALLKYSGDFLAFIEQSDPLLTLKLYKNLFGFIVTNYLLPREQELRGLKEWV